MIITKREVDLIKKAPRDEVFSLRVDFGQRTVSVVRKGKKAVLDNVLILDLEEKFKEKFCYFIEEQGVRKVYFFSDFTNRFYKLVPTLDWPTISISSVPMHSLASPKKYTQDKINLIKPYGHVFDTCMGLGYTAILASKTAQKVVTFEKDDNVYALAELNPLSKELFLAQNIEIRRNDVFEGIKGLDSDCFDCIIHDPPTFKLAGELFSQDFYFSLKRVLKKGGRLFHYTPLYKIKQGFDFPSKVKKRLKIAGFKGINYFEEAFGFLCKK